MAYSSSIKRAQAIKFCELCQEDSIKWRCIDCDMCLCNKCKTFHLRVPATAQHQIITIGAPLKNVQKKIVTDNIPCEDHPQKMTCLFCRSCDTPICPDCASSSHKKHIFDSIETVLDEKLEYLKSTTINDQIDAKTSEIQDIKPKYDAIFDESLNNIKQQEKKLLEATRERSKELQEKVENERSRINKIISKIERDVHNTKKNLHSKKDDIDPILNSNQASTIFKAARKIRDLKFDSFPNQVEQFIPQTNSKKKINEIFGPLQTRSIHKTGVLPEMELEVIRSFTTDLPLIDRVVTLDGTSAWINCYEREVIRKVDIQDNTMTTSQELSLDVSDMAVTHNDELLLGINGSDVKLLKKSGEIVTFLTVSPLLPLGIHVTKDNDVLVSVTEPDDDYTATDQSESAVIVYDMNGKQKDKYQYKEEGTRLFTCPPRITTNNNQDILVVDNTSGNTGRVVVLNKEGEFRWIYEGHDKINASEQFDPRDIVTTAGGHIIVSDYGTHALHVLSEDGDVVTYKVMTEMGLMYPWGLDIDDKGRLWLGLGTCENTQSGAKLHIIKIIS